MDKISSIASLLKKTHRLYSNALLEILLEKGHSDLRPSFLEILLYICHNEGASIKKIGTSCALKKQTMTSHLNELRKRGYIERRTGEVDKREFQIFLTEHGKRFRLALFESVEQLERKFSASLGEVEMERIQHILENFHLKVVTAIQSEN